MSEIRGRNNINVRWAAAGMAVADLSPASANARRSQAARQGPLRAPGREPHQNSGNVPIGCIVNLLGSRVPTRFRTTSLNVSLNDSRNHNLSKAEQIELAVRAWAGKTDSAPAPAAPKKDSRRKGTEAKSEDKEDGKPAESVERLSPAPSLDLSKAANAPKAPLSARITTDPKERYVRACSS